MRKCGHGRLFLANELNDKAKGRTTTSPDGQLSHDESELVGPFRPVRKFFMTYLYFVDQIILFIFSWRGTNELYEESVYKLASLSKCWKTILYLA